MNNDIEWMTANVLQLNLAIAWLWMLLGFVGGFLLGLNFHRADWLGGYASHRRRLYRLCHISFFGLGILNLLFYFTAREAGWSGDDVWVASRAFALGAVSMPVCCVVMAHRPAWRALFLVPVVSLLTAGTLTLIKVLHT